MKKRVVIDPSQREQASELAGKKIKKVRLEEVAVDCGQKWTASSPVFEFEDGSTLRFVVVETDEGEYGIDLVYVGGIRP